ncbi:KilA-N domain-containing protein [Geopseudomonas guangdongensis]|uniref:KilA-N domain-containing protein n=1 Tax=Geopseudomonas guangdongensis TaxID=1245526 RepID=A0A1H2I7H6_9GAMM|nr:KilA-N domain-containing protein [Pseudomonas guangdongensis]SDU39798.1 KilA-N domain-containing protein [Pseudomonas guangdongensis]
MTNAIITREYNGNVFTFREDGYFNMTDAAKKFGKRLDNFMVSPETKDYVEALSQTLDSRDCQVVQAFRGGRTPGTWGHPKLAVFFARWLDVKFAVFCDMVIDDILNKKAELTITQPAESMAMKVPQSFPEALRLAAELAEQNEKLASENKVMHDELNLLTVDEYRALTHRYFNHGYKVKLGQAATRVLRSEGREPDQQERTVHVLTASPSPLTGSASAGYI